MVRTTLPLALPLALALAPALAPSRSRLLTCSLGGEAYLNFIGNEWGLTLTLTA